MEKKKTNRETVVDDANDDDNDNDYNNNNHFDFKYICYNIETNRPKHATEMQKVKRQASKPALHERVYGIR